jgi:hypothetical protein
MRAGLAIFAAACGSVPRWKRSPSAFHALDPVAAGRSDLRQNRRPYAPGSGAGSRFGQFWTDTARPPPEIDAGQQGGRAMATNHPVTRQFASFAEFYPFYLAEHTNLACRRLHFVGSTLTLLCLAALVATFDPLWLLAAIVCGYGFAWVGHFFFEHNRPATFKQPLYSLMGDWLMYWQIVSRQIPF